MLFNMYHFLIHQVRRDWRGCPSFVAILLSHYHSGTAFSALLNSLIAANNKNVHYLSQSNYICCFCRIDNCQNNTIQITHIINLCNYFKSLCVSLKFLLTLGSSLIWFASSNNSSSVLEYLKVSSGMVASDWCRLSTNSTCWLQERNGTQDIPLAVHFRMTQG